MRRALLILALASLASLASLAIGQRAQAQFFGEPGESDEFGANLASGDFDGDGYDDLVIVAAGEINSGVNFLYEGQVHVVYGSPEGVEPRKQQLWNLTTIGVHPFDQGQSLGREGLESGDYDGDEFDDLAIGIPVKTVGGIFSAGQILVLRGSDRGLSADRHRYIEQPPGPQGFTDTQDQFGLVMESGDINGDGFDELAIGIEVKDVGDREQAGAVGLMFGGPNGLTFLGYDFIVQGVDGVPDRPETEDGFGASLAIADFGTDGYDDLIVGTPLEDKTHDSISRDGALFGFFGSEGGLAADSRFVWWVDGVPLQSFSQTDDKTAGGGAHVILSSGSSISVVGNTFWTMASEGLQGSGIPTAGFGKTLVTGDFNGDGFDDLAVGAPGDSLNGANEAGSVNLLYGSESWITADGARYLHQNFPPTESDIISPAAGASVNVGGASDPIDGQTPFVILWAPAEDPEGVPIEYHWQVSSDPNFTDTLTTVRVGFLNQFVTTLGFIGGLLRENGVEHEATVTWYHRIIASDGVDVSVSPAVAITLTLGAFVSTESEVHSDRAALLGNYPNPFTTATTIHYRTEVPGEVRLQLYDVRGSLLSPSRHPCSRRAATPSRFAGKIWRPASTSTGSRAEACRTRVDSWSSIKSW